MNKKEKIGMAAIAVISFIGCYKATSDLIQAGLLTLAIGITVWVLYCSFEEASNDYKNRY